MKTLKLFIGVFIFASCFIGCDSDSPNQEEIPQDDREELLLYTEIGTAELTGIETKADAFLDKSFKLIVKDNRTQNKFEDRNIAVTTQNEATELGGDKAKVVIPSDKTLYWDDLGGIDGDLNLSGVYFSSDITPADDEGWLKSCTLDADQSTNIEKNDLMLANVQSHKYDKNNKSASANLVFYHAMTKITLNLGGNYYTVEQLETAQVTIHNVYLSGNVSLLPTTKGNNYTYKLGIKTDVTAPNKNEIIDDIDPEKPKTIGYSHTAIVYPFSAKNEDQIATIIIAGNTYKVNLQADKTFKAGENNVFNVLINKSEVSVKASVVEWDDQKAIEITSKLQFDIKDILITDDGEPKSEKIITDGSLLHLYIKSDDKAAHTTTYKAKVTGETVSWDLEDGKHIYWDDLSKTDADGYGVNEIKAMLVLGGSTTKGDSIYVSAANKTLGKDIVDRFDLGNFTHPLAKFTIEVTTSNSGSSDWIDLNNIDSVVFPDGWYEFEPNDTQTGIKENTSKKLEGVDQKVTDKSVYVAFACPPKTSESLCTVNVKVDDNNSNAYTVKLAESTTFTAGNHYKYTIKITKTNITFTGQVVDWTDVVEEDPIETGL